MSRYYLAVLPLLSAFVFASPVLAENPFTDIRSFNVRKLVNTNLCPNCDLVGVDLRGAHLIGADLRKADLSSADLSWANLEGADLSHANLTGADLTGAFLTNASLYGADLDNANLSQAQLYFVDVRDASTDNLNLAGATVVGTPLSIGNGTDIDDETEPIISPEELWQLHPPNESQQDWPHNLIDISEEIPGIP